MSSNEQSRFSRDLKALRQMEAGQNVSALAGELVPEAAVDDDQPARRALA